LKRSHFVLGIIAAVLLLDQVLKFWVKTSMHLGQSFSVLGMDWFQIYFTENPGMAFGLEFGGAYGKIALTLFRMVAATAIGIYIARLIREKASYGLLAGMALIFSGAAGNIIDCLFYGIIFSGSEHGVATLFPEQGGYGPFLQGKVVDMLYFPLFSGTYPSWFPLVGGQDFLFFEPIFNLADAAITIGVLVILIGYRHFFQEQDTKSAEEKQEKTASDGAETSSWNG
jgi:signal peptidase II